MLDFSVTTFHSLISDHQSLNLDEKRLTHLIERAKDFSLMHGERLSLSECNVDLVLNPSPKRYQDLDLRLTIHSHSFLLVARCKV